MQVCRAMFEYLEAEQNGDCYFCCSNRIAHNKIGNIYENDFLKAWNSDIAVKMREAALNGSYPYCNLDNCPLKAGIDLTEPLENYKPYMTSAPLRVSFDLSKDCNAKCIYCRDEIYRTPDDEIENFLKKYNDKILPVIKNAECVFIGDSEDPFASRIARFVIKNITENFPNINFHIQTNGMLASEEKLRELKLEDKIKVINISVNAASAETYSKIFRVPEKMFYQLIKNLDNVSEILKTHKKSSMSFNFVVNKYNYKEMPDFIEFAKKYNAGVNFWGVRNYNKNLENKYEDIAVHLPEHKEYSSLKEVLSLDVFNSKMVNLYSCLKSVREEALKEKNAVI